MVYVENQKIDDKNIPTLFKTVGFFCLSSDIHLLSGPQITGGGRAQAINQSDDI